MARKKKPEGPEEPERPRHKPEGREHQVHKEILERRWRGGPEPTPEAYERALEQWKNLPGSVVRPPTDIRQPPDKKPTKPPDEGSPAPEKPEGLDKSEKENQP
jgi:hypothetical protein